MDFLAPVRSHLSRLIAHGTAQVGPDPNAMWLASLDVRTGRYPEDDTRPDGIPKRVYRNIDAPRGCTLYWDQPQLVAAHALSVLDGDEQFARAADDYVKAFLQRCVAKTGLFLWGNHFFWHAWDGRVMTFKSSEAPTPVDVETEDGAYHEARPIPPAWDLFWRVDPQATERAVRALGERHVFDHETGGFNRHADGKQSHAFLESGGILVESLAWLYTKTKDDALVERARRVARFSYNHRHEATGLVENDATSKRWDKLVCSTEVGLWAGSLLRAAKYSGDAEFMTMAQEATRAYLRHGFDEATGKYFGMVKVADGTHEPGDPEYLYQPRAHASLWRPLFPTHDYPMALAATCARLKELTGDYAFENALWRWAKVLLDETPAGDGEGAYAEMYGRAIWFLCMSADALPSRAFRLQAEGLAEEAIEKLLVHGMFRGHPGEERYDAVDGVGYLLLALIYLATGKRPDGMGFGF